jgi:hypothetical protein
VAELPTPITWWPPLCSESFSVRSPMTPVIGEVT